MKGLINVLIPIHAQEQKDYKITLVLKIVITEQITDTGSV